LFNNAAAAAPRRHPRRAAAAAAAARPLPTPPAAAAAASSSSSVPAAVSTAADSFRIPAAPDLIPDGAWEKIPGGGVTSAKGFLATGVYGGLRAAGVKADLALVVAQDPRGATAAGTFTTNVMCAAPVLYCQDAVLGDKGRRGRDGVRAVLANAGQANAATGDAGYADAVACAEAVAAALGAGVAPADVLLLSTGVIGRRIKMDAMLAAIPQLPGTLGASAEDGHRAAVAITTTDLVSKEAALRVTLPPASPSSSSSPPAVVTVGGMAKGSGMIHPNMATMLAVVTCDASVSPQAWRDMVARASDASFNAITVDGDTSTNDCVVGLASGAAAAAATITDASSPQGRALEAALTALLQGLAKSIAWDGEGATVLVEVEVTGAATDADARVVARSVAGSSLAKSAIFGGDPNWGRLAAAAGYSGVAFDQRDLGVRLGDTQLMANGQPLEFDRRGASEYLKGAAAAHGTVRVGVTVGGGAGRGMAWGCDLSYDYVKINAEYTT
jgi:glutamate N-acetyltransferase/amino-acid N-acetyltransferase